MFIHVKEAKYLSDYKVEILFNDGKRGIADLSDAITDGVFAVLQDESEFSKLFVDEELETIVWPLGLDFAPEYLYFKAFSAVPELQAQFRSWGYL